MEGVSVVIPTLNEEQNVSQLILRLDESFSAADVAYELIFIDDHSTDGTREMIKQFAKEFPIVLFEKEGKRGKAFSLLEGFSKSKYGTLCMIDADLQYPPEAIPDMLPMLGSVDMVVARRRAHNVDLMRRVTSQIFHFVFARFLHRTDFDVQSGLKVFKKEIISRLSLHPTPWSFDLELVLKAQQAGYQVDSYDVSFVRRAAGPHKMNLMSASAEIGFNALKLKAKRAEAIPFLPETEKIKGKGFHYKGTEFVHHNEIQIAESAFFRTGGIQALVIFSILLSFTLGLFLNWHQTILITIAALTFLYFADLLFNMFLIFRTFRKNPEIRVSAQEISEKSASFWPTYTIFCPLYHEVDVLPQFVSAINQLDYPKNKLQVLIILEEDDTAAIEKVRHFTLPSFFEIVVVPHSLPKTKPKALNFALRKACGEYCVIYDAEDIPEPAQLKKAVIAFAKAQPKTVCIQAKLNFYNPHQNVMTRVFTAEYSVWFDLILTGMQSINAPIPLGGTSNHFKTAMVRRLKGWDSFNVTEDCDLGMRLVKNGFRTAIVDSTTFEEANSHIFNWFSQRTRWIKGYLQTYLVHTRTITKLPISFQLIVGGKVFSMLINPVMWAITITYFAFRSTAGRFIESFFPAPVLYMGVMSFIFGNFLYLYYYMIGCAKREQYSLIKYAFLTPFYWLMMSIAAWRALIEIVRHPHYWDKTKHGFHLQKNKHLRQVREFIGHDLVDSRLVTSKAHVVIPV